MANEKQTAERAVLKWFETEPRIWYFKEHGDRYSKNGVPDFVASINGVFTGIEAKAGNGHKLSVVQLFNGLKLMASGGRFIVAYPDFKGIPSHYLKLQDFGLAFDDFIGVDKPLSLGQDKYMNLSKLSKIISEQGKSVTFKWKPCTVYLIML